MPFEREREGRAERERQTGPGVGREHEAIAAETSIGRVGASIDADVIGACAQRNGRPEPAPGSDFADQLEEAELLAHRRPALGGFDPRARAEAGERQSGDKSLTENDAHAADRHHGAANSTESREHLGAGLDAPARWSRL